MKERSSRKRETKRDQSILVVLLSIVASTQHLVVKLSHDTHAELLSRYNSLADDRLSDVNCMEEWVRDY